MVFDEVEFLCGLAKNGEADYSWNCDYREKFKKHLESLEWLSSSLAEATVKDLGIHALQQNQAGVLFTMCI